MGKVINMQDWVSKKEHLNEIRYYTEQLEKHQLQYSILVHKKVALFKKSRLRVLEGLIKSDRTGIKVYTLLYTGKANTFDEALSLSTVV